MHFPLNVTLEQLSQYLVIDNSLYRIYDESIMIVILLGNSFLYGIYEESMMLGHF